MRGAFGKLAITALVAIGLMGAFAASASADSVTCAMSGGITLKPGLSETPHVQLISLHNGKVTECSDKEKGTVFVEMKTARPVTCAVLRGPGAAVIEATIGFFWARTEESISQTFSMPLTEMTVGLEGTMANFEGGPPFAYDNISGTVTQKYIGTCGAKKKVRKGTVTGSVTLS